MKHQGKNRLSAFMLLGAFLISLVHSIPHFHHTHLDTESNIVLLDGVQSHSHEHSHYESAKDEDHTELHDWLNGHSHSTHFHDPYGLGSASKSAEKGQVQLAAPSAYMVIGIVSSDVFGSVPIAYPEVYCQRHFFSSHTLRGPPTLG